MVRRWTVRFLREVELKHCRVAMLAALGFLALGLLFMGFAVFGLAIYEGYDRISDRYPGYGRVWRKERKAYERRQEVRNGVRDDLQTS